MIGSPPSMPVAARLSELNEIMYLPPITATVLRYSYPFTVTTTGGLLPGAERLDHLGRHLDAGVVRPTGVIVVSNRMRPSLPPADPRLGIPHRVPT